jgi:transcription elongation factor GreA
MQVPRRRAETQRENVPEDAYVTPAAIKAMEEELRHLEKIARPQLAEEVSRTGQMGDLSENAGYQIAKQRLRGVNTRILLLQERLKRAIPIQQSVGGASHVRIGTTVTLRTGEREITYAIVGSLETNPAQGAISHTSPLGKALIGHAVGDVVTIQTPRGVSEYRIVKIL